MAARPEKGCIVIGNPVPALDAMPAQEIDTFTQRALQEAAAAGVTGKAVTPFFWRASWI